MTIEASNLTHIDGVIVLSNMLSCAKALKKKVIVYEKTSSSLIQGVVRKVRVHPRFGHVEFFCKGDKSGYNIRGACWKFIIN
jgi:hypothetical protein